MESKAVRDLVSSVSRALHEGNLEQARDLCRQLEAASPTDPGLPRQRAEISCMLDDRDGELAALIRAAELYSDAGQVIQAIGACKQILAIDPAHSETQQRLELLYDGSQPLATGLSATSNSPRALATSADAPLDELLLARTVPEAAPAPGSEVDDDAIAVIPLDPGSSIQFETDAVRAFEAQAAQSNESVAPQEELARTPLFGMLDAASLRRLIPAVELVELAEGDVLFREGDAADTLYVVVQGAVEAIAEGSPRRKLAVLEESEFFGEIGLVTNQPRNATIEALVDTRLLALGRSVIWDLIRQEPEVFKVMLRFLRERMVDRLARTGNWFANFSAAERAAVARQFRLLEVKNDAVLIEQGSETQGLFILLSGQMRVILMSGEGDKDLANLQPGDLFGEVSLLGDQPTTAAVVANGKCWALCLPAERFRGLAERHPELQATLTTLAQKRQRQNHAALRNASDLRDGNLGTV